MGRKCRFLKFLVLKDKSENNYLGVSLSGRAFRSNLLPFGTKGFPLQSLTQTAA
jgi:hypothetical protein